MQRKFWLRLSGMAAGAVLAMAAGGAAAAPFDRAAWLSDYAQLKTIMEKHYANLAWFASPAGGVDIPRLDHRTLAALTSAKSDDEARQAITDFVTAFKGGHFQISGPMPEATTKPAEVKRKPFDPSDTVAACAGLGYVPRAPITFSLPVETLPNFTLVSDGLTSPYRAGIATAANGTRIGFIHVQNFLERAFPATCTVALDKLKAKAGTDNVKIDADAVEDAADDEWFVALAEVIKTFKAQGVSVLLIDVGNNSGGDDDGDLFARLLTDKPVRSAPLRVVAAPEGRAYLSDERGKLDKQLETAPAGEAHDALVRARDFFVKAEAEAGTPCDMSWVWKERRKGAGQGCTRLVDAGYAGGFLATLPKGAYGDQSTALRLSLPSRADDQWGMWTGPFYVLTDHNSFSSAEMFAAVVQDNRIGKTVGQTSGGDGCGFMSDDVAFVLDHSKLRLRIPDCLRLRADGSNEVSGIKPDIPVLPTDGEDTRQRANRLIEAVAADVGR